MSLRTQWYGWTPIFFAASHDNVETFEELSRHSPQGIYEAVDGDGWTLLHVAVYFCSDNIMRLLLERGADPQQLTTATAMLVDPELAYLELTAKDIAIYMGPKHFQMYVDALEATGQGLLVEEWGDVFWDAQDFSGPVHSAAPCDSASDFGVLAPSTIYGAEDGYDRWTLLHWAPYCGSPKISRLLLMKGADPRHSTRITAYLPPGLESLELTPRELAIRGGPEEQQKFMEALQAIGSGARMERIRRFLLGG